MTSIPPELLDAVQEGKLVTIQKLLKQNPHHVYGEITDDDDNSDGACWSLMHHACWHGQFAVVEELYKRGARVNVRGKGGWLNTLDTNETFRTKLWTPLHAAAVNGHIGVVAFLLECGGASLASAVDATGATAAHVAAMEGHTAVVALCLGDYKTVRNNSSTKGVHGLATLADKQGATCLHHAMRRGQLDTAVYLIRAHPSLIFVKDHQNKSALDVAKGETSLNLVHLLVAALALPPSHSTKEGEQLEEKEVAAGLKNTKADAEGLSKLSEHTRKHEPVDEVGGRSYCSAWMVLYATFLIVISFVGFAQFGHGR